MDTVKSLNIVTALGCEAAPIIEHYQLKKSADKPFAFFSSGKDSSDQATAERGFKINLVVTGIGALNMATACGWLAACTVDHSCAWLNIGVAGHASWQPGESGLVHRVLSEGEQRSHYPPLVAGWSGKTFALCSYVAPCTDYPIDHAVDMEGAAYFKAALKFASSELVQAIKIISDNDANDVEQLNPAKITQLIRPSVGDIANFVKGLMALQQDGPEPLAVDDLLAGVHCTVAQQLQLTDLVQKARAVAIPDQQIRDLIQSGDSMQLILQEIRTALNSSPPNLT